MTVTTPPAPPTSRSNRRAFAIAALVAGFVAGAIVVDVPPGLNMIVVGALMSVAVLFLARERLSLIGWILGAAAFVFLSMFAVRTSEIVLFADLCAAGGLASLALNGGSTWRAVARGGFAVLARLHRSLGPVVRPLLESVGPLGGVARSPMARGSVIGLVLAIGFGILFASADRAFAQIAEDLLVPRWEVGLLPARVVAALMVVGFTGAYGSLALVPVGAGVRSPWGAAAGKVKERRYLQVPEWVVPLVLIDLVFLAFVLVQVTVLFGGNQHVLQTAGLTYAEYARSGFFQLVAIAGLVLVVIAAAVHLARTEDARDRNLLKILLGVLCVLTLVVLFSALRRLGLYEEAYGFTRLRFVVHVAILWLGLVLVAVMGAGIRWNARWLPRAVVGLTATMLLAVNLINPDAFVARRNLERFEATGKIDTYYLSTLSPDAVPVLVGAPEDIRRCALIELDDRLGKELPVWSWNLSRERAKDALASVPPAPSADCPGYLDSGAYRD